MGHERIGSLKAEELRLLDARTRLQRDLQRRLDSGVWRREEVEELSRRQDELQRSLASVRERMESLQRSGSDAPT